MNEITRDCLGLTEFHRIRKTWLKEPEKKSYRKQGGNNQRSERNQRIQGKLLVKSESSRGICFQQRATEGHFNLRFHTLYWTLSGQSFLSEILRLHKPVRMLLKKRCGNVLTYNSSASDFSAWPIGINTAAFPAPMCVWITHFASLNTKSFRKRARRKTITGQHIKMGKVATMWSHAS